MTRAASDVRPAPAGRAPVALILGLLLGMPAEAADGALDGALAGALPDGDSPAACTAATPFDLDAAIERARKALMEEDLATVDSVQAELVHAAPCIDHVVAPDLWARHLISLAIAAYVRNEDWQTPLASALAASPTVNRVVRGDTLFARWTPPPTTPTSALPIAYDVHAYLDGRRVTVAEPLRGPHLVQVEVDGKLSTRLVDADGSDAVWQDMLPEPPVADAPAAQTRPTATPVSSSDPNATPWIIAGGSGVVLGGGVGVATWAMRGQGDSDPGQQGALVAGNVIGWSVAAVGGALLGVGVVQALDASPHLRIGPGTIRLEGRF